MHRVFDGLEFRVLRDRLFATLEAVEDEAEGGFEVDGSRARHRCGGRVARRACRARRPSASTSRGPGRGAPGTRRRWPSPPRAGRRPTSTSTALDEADEEALGEWLADPARPKVLHDAKGPLAGSARPGLAAARAQQRHRAGGLPRAARPAHLRPRRPRRCATSARAALRGRGRRAGDARVRRRRRRRGRRGDGAGAGRARAVPGARHRARGHRGQRRCCATSSCRSSTCSPRWSAPASPPTPRR